MFTFTRQDTLVVELVDTPDLKSCGLQGPYGFDSRPGYRLPDSYRGFRLGGLYLFREFASNSQANFLTEFLREVKNLIL